MSDLQIGQLSFTLSLTNVSGSAGSQSLAAPVRSLGAGDAGLPVRAAFLCYRATTANITKTKTKITTRRRRNMICKKKTRNTRQSKELQF